ncbi:MAG TPA: YbaK/EbsC family protein [Candidatus Limnocylindria bacterium]|nr:YbaK/EbsC family protein [Candidatus Limnocylindria bacterium]
MRDAARQRGLEISVRRSSATTHTAQDAAREIGCDVAEIVKSVVFLADGLPVVVLCSGADRVDLAKLRAAVGTAGTRQATADEAKAATGYAIGGIPPFGHATACRVVADRALRRYARVWAAAGLPDAVFAIAPEDLVRASGALEVDVT